MKETIRIGREAGIRVVGSHIKAKGPSHWGQSAVDVLLIERARASGVQVYLDQYPYETFGGGPTAVIPLWAYAPPGTDRSGGLDDPRWNQSGLLDHYKDNLANHLADRSTHDLLVKDIEHILDLQGGADRHIIVVAPGRSDLIGKTLSDVAVSRNETPVETLIHLAMNSDPGLRSGVLFRPVAGHQFDVENYMRQDYTATSTDGGVVLNPRPGQHPRYFGTYPRKFGHYVRDRGVITLPFAVRSSTGLPAHIIGLEDRGLIKKGYRADIVVFDAESIRGNATILEPGRYPTGVAYVMANGVLTVDGGERTGALPGEVLVKSGRPADSDQRRP